MTIGIDLASRATRHAPVAFLFRDVSDLWNRNAVAQGGRSQPVE
jgi:hypothetical protein